MKPITASVDILSPAEKQMIHDKSLTLLEKVGLYAPHGPFLRLMEERGATVDHQSQIIRFSPQLIGDMVEEEKARVDAPALRRVAPLTGGISTEIFLVDYRSGTRRHGLMDDVRKGIALLRRLENFPTADAVVIPSDVPETVTDLESFRTLYTYSEKPGGTYIHTPQSAVYIIEMAKAMGREVNYGFQTASPFRFTPETLELAMLFHQKGMKAACGPFVMAMGNAPVTVAGALLTQNAEALACMFITRALGGEPGGYNSVIHPMDPATLLCSFGSPFLGVSAMAGSSMARYYGLYPGGNVGLTDALQPDFQCGFEKALGAVLSAFSGGGGIGGQGIVGADQGISLEQLVIDNEWISAFNASIGGVEVSEETLAEALIHELGIGGSFLGEEHTVEHMRQSYWSSSIFNRLPWDHWAQNPRTLLDKAWEKVEAFTAGYKDMEPVIPPALREEIDRIADEGCRACLRG